MPDLDAVILAATNKGRRQGLVHDKLFGYILAEVRKSYPDIRWRSLRKHIAGVRARRALTALTDEPETVVNVDTVPYSWKKLGPSHRLEIKATPQGLLIPWPLVNKLKRDFSKGL